MKSVIYSPRTVAYLYVEAISQEVVIRLVPEVPAASFLACPPFFHALDESVMYRAYPGAWVAIRVPDLRGEMVVAVGLVISPVCYNKVKVVIVPSALGRREYVSRRKLGIFLHARPSDIMECGDTLYVCVDGASHVRRFENGLEIFDAHLKQLMLPTCPPQDIVQAIGNQILPRDPGLWEKAKIDLLRYELSTKIIGERRKVVMTGYAGGVAVVKGLGVTNGDPDMLKVDVWIRGRKFEGEMPTSYLARGLSEGDEVNGRDVDGRRIQGWIICRRSVGLWKVHDHARVGLCILEVWPVLTGNRVMR